MENRTLEEYYREREPGKRREILEALLSQEPGEENALRKELFDLRYKGKSQRRDQPLPDGYVALWMNMKITLENSGGFFGVRSARKQFVKDLNRLGILRFMELNDTAKKLLYDELYHMAVLYIDSCRKDRNYTSTIMGLVHMSDDQILKKLTEDVFSVAVELPERLNMKEEFALFSRAALDAFDALLPGQREQMKELISKKER